MPRKKKKRFTYRNEVKYPESAKQMPEVEEEPVRKFEMKNRTELSTVKNFQYKPGSKIALILHDLRRILARTRCKSLQETYKKASKTSCKVSCQTSYHDPSKMLQDVQTP